MRECVESRLYIEILEAILKGLLGSLYNEKIARKKYILPALVTQACLSGRWMANLLDEPTLNF